MQVGLGRLYYQRHDFDHWRPLPRLRAVTLGEYSLRTVLFDEGVICFPQKAMGDNCTLRLGKGDYNLYLLSSSNAVRVHDGNNAGIAIEFQCIGELQCEITSSRGEKGETTAQAFPLAQLARHIRHIRLELSESPHNWKIVGAQKPKTSTQSARAAPHWCRSSEVTQISQAKPAPKSLNAATPVPLSRETPSSITGPASVKPIVIIDSTGRSSSLASRVHANAMHPQIPLVLTPAQLPKSRKRTLTEIEAEEDNLEKEKVFMAKYRERKRQLREERKGAANDDESPRWEARKGN